MMERLGNSFYDRDILIVEDDDQIFFEEEDAENHLRTESKWQVMIVDDEIEVHHVTKLALQKFTFADRHLQFISAYSGEEAKQLIQRHPQTAIMLLDVVMESNNSGLLVAKHVREVLGNERVRIILRTGQPGEAPEQAVIINYDINDYKTKTELTQQKLFTTIVSALRSYRDITTLESSRRELHELYHDLEERSQALKALNDTLTLEVKERQQAQIELERARDAAEAANRAKSEFLATMSHELRTPLQAILGKAELMQEEIYGPLNHKQHDSLNIIESSGQHLLALINDILDLAKIEAGKVALELSQVSVASVCQTSLQVIRQMAQTKGLSVGHLCDPDVTIMWADERRLTQILMNLLNNAVKFTSAGGRIGLDVERDAERDHILFTVWDTGIGIAPKDQKRLFEPFVQLDSNLARHYEGTGLGLSLVRNLTKMHNGSVAIESAVGQGSRFTISLPRRPDVP